MASSGPIPGTFFKKANSFDGPIAQLTDNSGGTASDTIAAIGSTYNQNEVRNAVASLAAKVNYILGVLKEKGLVK